MKTPPERRRLELAPISSEIARALVVHGIAVQSTEGETNGGLTQIQFRRTLDGPLYNLTLTRARR